MKYKIQNGVIREVICGQNLLISTLEARKVCPYLTQLNESSALIWEMLEQARDTEEMAEKISREYEISVSDAKNILLTFLKQMEEQHFIVRENQNE